MLAGLSTGIFATGEPRFLGTPYIINHTSDQLTLGWPDITESTNYSILITDCIDCGPSLYLQQNSYWSYTVFYDFPEITFQAVVQITAFGPNNEVIGYYEPLYIYPPQAQESTYTQQWQQPQPSSQVEEALYFWAPSIQNYPPGETNYLDNISLRGSNSYATTSQSIDPTTSMLLIIPWYTFLNLLGFIILSVVMRWPSLYIKNAGKALIISTAVLVVIYFTIWLTNSL